MKPKHFFLLFTLININLSFSQHPDLQQGNWYVESVTENGITTNIPKEPLEFPYAYINFFDTSSGLIGSANHQLFNSNCQIGFTGHLNYTSNVSFTFIDINIIQNATTCNSSIQDFMNLYVDFYNNYAADDFSYIINIDGDGVLTITNSNNDIMVYSSHFYNPPQNNIATDTWFLSELIIDNNNNLPPNNDELSNIPLNFINQNGSGFTTNICDSLIASSTFNTNTFYIYNMSIGLIECSLFENNNYQNLYFNFFIDNLPGPFNYSLSNSNNTLTITSLNGNQAIYSNQVTAIKNYLLSKISLYPNPTKNTIKVKSLDKKTEIKNIYLFNIIGDMIFQTQTETIDISSLENGIYLIKIKTNNNKIILKKIIKE